MEQESNESELFFQASDSRRCRQEAQTKWEQLQISALQVASAVDPFETDLPVGVIIPTLDAVGWSSGRRNVDIRPRLVDKSSGEVRLLDSGAQISAAAKGPEDKLDNNIKLVAVNGSRINTYGTRQIEVKIGRKAYSVTAVVCDIAQDILGMDFISKYKLGFEWDEFDQSELFITDKRADIKERLQIVTVPVDIPRAHHTAVMSADKVGQVGPSPTVPLKVSAVNAEQAAFELACMKALGDKESVEERRKVEEKIKIHDPEYQQMIKQHPELLNPTFTKDPSHGVFHRIETSGPPCKSKRRPIIANSEKAQKGKEALTYKVKKKSFVKSALVK